MKKNILIAIATIAIVSTVVLVFMYLATLVHNSKPPMQISNVIQRVEKSGYFGIRSAEFKRGTYELEGYNSTGSKVKIYFHPALGLIKANHSSNGILTMLQVTKKLEAIGYNYIYKIDFDNNYYKIKGFDKNNKKIQLQVDAKTGIVKEHLYD